MYVFSCVTKHTSLYPPHGVRVAVFTSVGEMISDIYEHLEATVDKSITIPTAMNPKELEDILDQHLEGSWSICSGEHGYLPNWDTTKFAIDIIGPDEFPIEREGVYHKEVDLTEAINRFVDRYRHQGYYSSVRKRISLEELPLHCRVVWVELDEEEEETDVPAAS